MVASSRSKIRVLPLYSFSINAWFWGEFSDLLLNLEASFFESLILVWLVFPFWILFPAIFCSNSSFLNACDNMGFYSFISLIVTSNLDLYFMTISSYFLGLDLFIKLICCLLLKHVYWLGLFSLAPEIRLANNLNTLYSCIRLSLFILENFWLVPFLNLFHF